METIFKTDKNGNQRYTSIRVQKLKDGTANIIKATGVVDGKESISTTHVPLGYESALKRAKTIWKNLQTPDVMPMLANKWDDRKKYISEPFYVQPKLDGVRLLVSNKGGISRTGKLVPGTELGHLQLKGRSAELYASARVKKEKELTWKKWAKRFQKYLHMLEFLFAPDAIIVGGGVSRPAKIREYAKYLNTNAELLFATLENEAGIIGAACAAAVNDQN